MKKLFAAMLSAVLCFGAMFGLSGCGKELIGFDADLARAAGEKLGLKVEFKVIDWDAKVTDLKSGYIDCAWNGMTIRDDLKDNISFSIPYMNNSQIAVIRKQDKEKYKTQQDMIDKKAKMTAESGSAGELDIMNKIFKDNEKKAAKDMMTAMLDVSANSCDVAILDLVMASYLLSGDSTYADKLMVVSDLVFSSEKYGIGFEKGNLATVAKINEALTELERDGTIDKIATTYGLEGQIELGKEYDSFDSVADKSGWEKIQKKGKLVVGITLFAPISFYK